MGRIPVWETIMPHDQWPPEAYKTAYEGFEVSDNFATPAALAAYRQPLIEETGRETAFTARHLGRRKLRIMDLGSGNGRLLVTLGLEGMVAFGLGVEVSRSRVAFAQQWVSDLGLQNIQMVAADVLEFAEFEAAAFDIVTCVGVFSYFRPIRKAAAAEMLAHNALAPDGCLLLHVYQMSSEREQTLALARGRLRVWRPLPPEDRFAYYLSELEYVAQERILTHRKTFIARDGSIDTGRVEVTGYDSPAELVQLLHSSGFPRVQLYSDFDDAPFREGESEMLVVLAGKSEWQDRSEGGYTPAPTRYSSKDGPGAWVRED
jgi:SAM-dependent methyltransferase